ncbi:MFS transporter [Salinispora cortesiana]|uniref:MFS transporter n=1 Tax=Salinispora cortesiana TaxID=1305843 RepID=UPI00041201A6|nr:MFS transporter [Salinispora cortesiana]
MPFSPRFPRLPGRGVASVAGGGRPPRGLTLGAAAACIFIVQLDFYALSLALPSMAAELHSSTTDLQWVISGYILAQAAFLIPGGKLGDILGRRRILVGGLAIFGMGSLGAGLGSDPPTMIAFRVVQGMGSGIVYPLAFAVITEAFPGRRAKRAIGNAYGIGAVALALGPLFGGGLTELVSWRSVLLANVPLCLVAIVAAVVWLPESSDPTVSRRIDLVGLVVVVLGIVAITVAADRMNAWRPVVAAAVAVGGLVLLAAFVLRERVAESPLVRLDLFHDAKFVAVTLLGLVANIALVVMIFATTIHLQQVRGYSPFVAGLAVCIASISGGGASPFAGRLSEWVAVRRLIVAAILVGALGLLVVAFGGAIWPYLISLAVAGFGYRIGFTVTTLGTQAMVPAERAGEVSGVTLSILFAGSGVAVAAAGTLIEQGDLATGVMRVLLGIAAGSAVAAVLLARLPRST